MDSGYAEFTIDGPAKSQVHLTGFYNPQGPAGGGDDDDDEDAIAKVCLSNYFSSCSV